MEFKESGRPTEERSEELLGKTPAHRGPNAETRSNPIGLTRRQMEVFRLLARGYSNAQAARELHRSEKTVGHHVSAILAKLHVRSRTAAVVVGYSLGVLKPAAPVARPAVNQLAPEAAAPAGGVATRPRRSSSGSMRGSWPAKSRKSFIASSLPPLERRVCRK